MFHSDTDLQFMFHSGTEVYSSCYTLGQRCTVHATLCYRGVQFMLHSGTEMYSSLCYTLGQTCTVHALLWCRNVQFMVHSGTEVSIHALMVHHWFWLVMYERLNTGIRSTKYKHKYSLDCFTWIVFESKCNLDDVDVYLN